MHTIILVIYFFNNFYFPQIMGSTTDLFVNIPIVVFLMVKNRNLSVNRKFITPILTILIYICINVFITFEMYYFFQFIRNIIFILATFLIFKSITAKKIFRFSYLILWMNNLVIALQISGTFNLNPLLERINSVFGIVSRMDYRTSGILDGPLKAGLISVFLLIYTLYFIEKKYLKLFLTILLVSFSLLQARTALLLSIIVVLVWLLYILKETDKISIKTLTIPFFSLLLVSLFSNIMIKFLRNNFPYFENTLNWQKRELLNLGNSNTINVLLDGGFTQIRFFYENQSLVSNLFGNGLSNWNGVNSIQSDNGFVTLMIGLGAVGTFFMAIMYIFLFYGLYKYFDKFITEYKSIAPILFLILIVMNIKSTSFLGYHYFNLIMFTYFLFYYLCRERWMLKKITLRKNIFNGGLKSL